MKQKGGLLFAALLCTSSVTPAVQPPYPPELIVRSQGDAVVRALEAALIMSGQEGGTVRLAVLVAPLRTSGKLTSVHVLAEVDGRTLIENFEGHSLEIDLFFYMLDSTDEVVVVNSRHLKLDLEQHGQLIQGTGLKIPVVFDLPPGEYVLRLLVRSATQAYGIRSVPVSVSKASDPSPMILPIMIPEPPGRWLVALDRRQSSDGTTDSYPFAVGGKAFVPSSLPVVASGEQVQVYLLTRGLESSSSTASVHLKHNEFGTVDNVTLDHVDRLPTPVPSIEALVFEFQSAGLAPGIYTVLTTLELSGSESVTSLPSSLVVSSPGQDRVWTQLDLDTASQGQRTTAKTVSNGPIEIPVSAPKEFPHYELENDYLGVLRLVAYGEHSAAVSSLASLEARAAVLLGGHDLRVLRDLEWRILYFLATRDGNCLLPAHRLHSELATRYRNEGRQTLAVHATGMAARLVEAYAEMLDTPEARRNAAAGLTALAGSLQRASVLNRAAELFARAIELDETLEAALLGLATTYEKQAHFQFAVQTLDRLLQVQPSHSEARLRMALNLKRISKPHRAEELLRQLLALSEPEWIASLAHQELARLQMEQGRAQESADILQRGLTRWPRHWTLHIQMAYLLDQLEQPVQAQVLLSELDFDDSSMADSDRFRYSHWPAKALARCRSRVEAQSHAMLPTLRRALADAPPRPSP